MIRKIIEIDEGKCNGCGLCAKARTSLSSMTIKGSHVCSTANKI